MGRSFTGPKHLINSLFVAAETENIRRPSRGFLVPAASLERRAHTYGSLLGHTLCAILHVSQNIMRLASERTQRKTFEFPCLTTTEQLFSAFLRCYNFAVVGFWAAPRSEPFCLDTNPESGGATSAVIFRV